MSLLPDWGELREQRNALRAEVERLEVRLAASERVRGLLREALDALREAGQSEPIHETGDFIVACVAADDALRKGDG